MSGLDKMKQRFQYAGGVANGRNTEGKLRSFHTALKNSYQSEWITLHKGEENEKRVLCLINPSRLTEEFDKKVLSIDPANTVAKSEIVSVMQATMSPSEFVSYLGQNSTIHRLPDSSERYCSLHLSMLC